MNKHNSTQLNRCHFVVIIIIKHNERFNIKCFYIQMQIYLLDHIFIISRYSYFISFSFSFYLFVYLFDLLILCCCFVCGNGNGNVLFNDELNTFYLRFICKERERERDKCFI